MLSGPADRRLFSLFLVGTLLLCHGAFGALHQLEEQSLLQRPFEHHPAVHTFGDHALADPASHRDGGHGISRDAPAGSANYTAVLVILLLGAGCLLLCRTSLAPPPLAPASVRLRAFLPPRARGPSPPLLQVFRL